MRLVAPAHVGKRWERRKSDGRSLAFPGSKGIRGREEMSPFFPAVFFQNLTTACTSLENGTLSSPVSAYSWPYKSALVNWIPRSYIRIVVHRIWQLRNNAAKTKKNKK